MAKLSDLATPGARSLGVSNIVEGQSVEYNHGNSESSVTPPENQPTAAAKQEKKLALQYMGTVRAQIETLSSDIAKRISAVPLLEQDLQNLKEEYDGYLDEKKKSILGYLREAARESCGKLDMLGAKLTTLKKSEQRELEILCSNALMLSRKETLLMCCETIIESLTTEEMERD